MKVRNKIRFYYTLQKPKTFYLTPYIILGERVWSSTTYYPTSTFNPNKKQLNWSMMDKWHDDLVYNFKLAWENTWKPSKSKKEVAFIGSLWHKRCSCKWLVPKESLKESGWLFLFCHGITKYLFPYFCEHPKAQKVLHVGNQFLLLNDEVKGYAWEGVGCPHDEIKGYVWEGIPLWNWSLEETWTGEGNFH